MKILALFQSKNEGVDNVKAVIEQAKIMSDGLIILDDGSDDNSFPPEVLKDPIILEYVKLPPKEMFEGINMSVLLNIAHAWEADWCYFPAGHYRYIGDLKNFKEQIKMYDTLGITHVNLRWFTMWEKGKYRDDGKFDPKNRYFCDIWKVQPHTWFKIKTAHCTHPENMKEFHTVMDDVASVTYGRDSPEKRKKKYEQYSKMKDMDETFEHYLDTDVVLKDYDEEAMMKVVNESNLLVPKYWVNWVGETFIDQRLLINIAKGLIKDERFSKDLRK